MVTALQSNMSLHVLTHDKIIIPNNFGGKIMSV